MLTRIQCYTSTSNVRKWLIGAIFKKHTSNISRFNCDD